MDKQRKRDLILLLSLLAVGAALALTLWLRRAPGAEAVVLVDNAELARFPLSTDVTYPIETAYGSNLLLIEHGTARLTEADCPDKLCVKQGAVQYAGDSIICLPHKLVVEIVGGADELGLDAVAK